MDLPAPRQRQLQQWATTAGLPTADLNWARLDQALTHKSVDPLYNYEQLELLGDAVLRLAATEYLQERFPQASVGELSAVRSQLVSDRTLGQLGQDLGLAQILLVDAGFALGPSQLADALEAVVAAIYLETHTLEQVHTWLDGPLHRLAIAIRQDPARQNYKVALQELTQAHTKTLPTYHTTESPPIDGDPQRYTATVWFQDVCWGSGHGPTKKQAQQAAAAAAYPALAAALGAPVGPATGNVSIQSGSQSGGIPPME